MVNRINKLVQCSTPIDVGYIKPGRKGKQYRKFRSNYNRVKYRLEVLPGRIDHYTIKLVKTPIRIIPEEP